MTIIESQSMPETVEKDRRLAKSGSLELCAISKTYHGKNGDFCAVQHTDLNIAPGTFVTLLGPSGCGKTTTLRMIAGFEQPTGGDILLDGESILDMPADKRPMSTVFQSYALFPHLSVRGNVEFGLKLKKMDKALRCKKVDEALEMMGIEQYADRYPHQLSGGQQQRVALARALVMEPKIILFDEPLSNLDARLRVKMRGEIRALQRRLGITAIFVTHDQSEALTMADVIVVMSAGRVEQIGSPWDIYHHPVNRFVASFLGTSNFLEGQIQSVENSGASDNAMAMYSVSTAFGDMAVAGVTGMQTGDKVNVVVRAEDLLVGGEAGAGRMAINCSVVSSAFDGQVVNYTLDTATGQMIGSAPGSMAPAGSGAEVTAVFDCRALWCVPVEKHGA